MRLRAVASKSAVVGMLALGLGSLVAGAQSAVDGHIAKAKASAGKDFEELFATTCGLVKPPAAIAGQVVPTPAAPPPAGAPSRATWHAEPAKVFDNLYFVGQTEYSAWAVTTSDGIILMDAIFDYSVEDEVIGGLKALGLDPSTIKYVVISHAHGDHVGGARFLQDRGARIVMSAADWDLMERTQVAFAKPKRDVVATDGQRLTLGDTTITLHVTPGHTLGTISSLIPVKDGRAQHVAAYWGGTAFNWVRGPANYITPDRPARFWFATYAASAQRFRGLASRAGADVILSNHTNFDGSKTRIPALRSRAAGAPHPYVIGKDAVQRFLTVADECAQAGLDGAATATAPSASNWTNDLSPMTPQRAVDWLVDYERVDNSAAKPFEESGVWDAGMDPFPPSRAEAVRIGRERGEALGVKVLPDGSSRRLQPVVDKFFYGLRANSIETQRLGVWWANRMLATPRPLEEKLTLFWHGHFATGDAKVRDYRMMLRQNQMLRTNASGRLRDLLVGILEDPAMLVYLDNGENVKAHPNENFGRELLELFTMGVGHYTERDVREAARAFTGWTNDVLAFKFDKEQHDFGTKTFLGVTGPLNGSDVVDTILAQPATGEHVGAKIYRYFVREDISPAVKTELGRGFKASGYQVKPLLKRILLSKDFYAPPSMASQIKSPVVLVLSTYKKLGLRELPTIPDFGRLTGALGQTLFDPPNVAGWAGGRTWITPATLLQRGNLFRDVLFAEAKGFRAPDRLMPGTYARVGDNLAKGMNITEATKDGTGDAESNAQVDRDEDYNTRYASYRGYLMAFERTKPIPRRVADFSLVSMTAAAHAETPEAIVDYFAKRFLSVPLGASDRASFIEFLRAKPAASEDALRELLYLVLSAPGYQVN